MAPENLSIGFWEPARVLDFNEAGAHGPGELVDDVESMLST